MKNSCKLLYAAIAFLLLSTAAIMLLPVYQIGADSQGAPLMPFGTIAFWVGAVGGCLLLILFYRKQKELHAKGSIGIITFFRNPLAALADIVLILSVLITAVLAVFNLGSMIVFSILFGLVFLSANLHCIFNGRVYHTLRKKEERGK